MKATITGNDSLSKRILVDLKSGLRVSEVPERYPVSLDQAKRLSRLRRMLELAAENMEKEHYDRLEALGLKSLPLSPFIKKQDWAGLLELLAAVTEETTRDELQLLINGLEEKRRRITELKENTDLQLSELEKAVHALSKKEQAVLQAKKGSSDKQLKDIRKKRLAIQAKISSIKNQAIRTYLEVAEAPDFLSAIHLKQHKHLQQKALEWLFKRGFVAVPDFPLPNGKKAEIFGFNESQMAIIDIKVSKGDLLTDQTWKECLSYCHDFYFFIPAELIELSEEKMDGTGCGILVDSEEGMRMLRPDTRKMRKIRQGEELKFAAGQLLSRKVIFGY